MYALPLLTLRNAPVPQGSRATAAVDTTLVNKKSFIAEINKMIDQYKYETHDAPCNRFTEHALSLITMSGELVKILNEPPGDIRKITIETRFNEARNIVSSVCNNTRCDLHSIVSNTGLSYTTGFMVILLTKWLDLPELQEYVFDDYGSSPWGEFHRRRDGEGDIAEYEDSDSSTDVDSVYSVAELTSSDEDGQ